MQQRLHEQDHADAQRAGPRPDEHGRERPTEQVAARARRPTGKLIICPAKTNAATSPAIGAVRSSSSGARLAQRDRDARGRDDRPVATEVGASRNPSGTCMSVLLIGRRSGSTLRVVGWSRTSPPYCMPFATAPARSGAVSHSHERPGPPLPPATPPPTSRSPPTPATQRLARSSLRRPQGDRLLLPGRDDARLHASRPATSPTPSTRCKAAGYDRRSASPRTPPPSWRSSASATG